MQPEDMILVSVDDHLVEPPNLFEGSSEVWTCNGAILPDIGASLGTISATLDV